jgi:hypothetical protein
VLLEVQFPFSDHQPMTRGPSARTTRTVCPAIANFPPSASQSC